MVFFYFGIHIWYCIFLLFPSLYILQYSDGNFVMLCFALLPREVLVVPTDKPLSEDQAWSYLRDIILGTEYCKSYNYQLRASTFDTQTQSLESQTLTENPLCFTLSCKLKTPNLLTKLEFNWQTLKPLKFKVSGVIFFVFRVRFFLLIFILQKFNCWWL